MTTTLEGGVAAFATDRSSAHHLSTHRALNGSPRVTAHGYMQTFGQGIANDIEKIDEGRLAKADAAAKRNAEKFPVLERFPISGSARSHRGRPLQTPGPKGSGYMPPAGWPAEVEEARSGGPSKRVDESRAMEAMGRAFVSDRGASFKSRDERSSMPEWLKPR